MKNLTILFIIITIIFLSCTEYDKKNIPSVYEIETLKSKEFVAQCPENSLIHWKYQYKIIEGIESLIVSIITSTGINYLQFYDLETEKLYNQITLDKYKRLENYEFINKDSIFLYYSSYFPTDTNNLILVDFTGNLKNCYNTAFVSCSNGTDTTNFYPQPTLVNMCFHNSEIIMLNINIAENDIGTKKYCKFPPKILAKLNTKTNTMKICNNLVLPNISETTYYPSDFMVATCCLSKDNNPLIRFFYSSYLYEYDCNNDRIIKTKQLKSMLIDSIMPLDYSTSRSSNNIEAQYSYLEYDPYSEMYFSNLFFSNEKYGNVWSVILADKELNYLGELYKPKKMAIAGFTKDYYVSAGVKDMLKEPNKIVVTYNKLKKTNQNFNEYMSCIKDSIYTKRKMYENGIHKYMYGKNENYLLNYLTNNRNIKDSNFVILTIYSQDGCHSCREKISKLLSDNFKIFNKVPIYIIYSANDVNLIKEDLKNFKINMLNNLIIDSVGIVKNLPFKSSIFNPRLTIVRNNNVVIDSIYDSFNIEYGLIPKMLESLDLKIQ